MKDPLIVTWTFAGNRFFACWNGSSWHVMGENRMNYGSWGTVEKMREYQQRSDDLAQPVTTNPIDQVVLIPKR
jgi:hypothetical protein